MGGNGRKIAVDPSTKNPGEGGLVSQLVYKNNLTVVLIRKRPLVRRNALIRIRIRTLIRRR